MSGSREAMLASVRAALQPPPEVLEVPRAYQGAGVRGVAGDSSAVDLFCERVADYQATVTRVSAADLTDTLKLACRRRGASRLAVPAHVPPWTLEGIELVRDDPPLSPRQLDGMHGVLSGCALAIAETGTIVLDGVGPSGRRALTLVPDYHLCVVAAQDIVRSVPDCVAALGAGAPDGRPITLISGPSATVDIELVRVNGVHGPRTLDVFVVET